MGNCLFRTCRSLVKGGGTVKDVVFQPPALSNDIKGENVRVDFGRLLSGRGAACGTECITHQGVYFEVRVRTAGPFACGIMEKPSNPSRDLDKGICDNKTSFGLRSENLAADPMPGDIIGVYVDMNDGSPHLSFALNGLPLGDMYDVPKHGKIKSGTYYPVVYVNSRATVEVAFEERHWKYHPDIISPEEETIVAT